MSYATSFFAALSFSLVAVISSTSVATASAASPATPAAPVSSASSKSFAFRIAGDPETLDWNLAHTTIETNLLVNLMEGLVTFDSNMKVVPALAKSWEVGADGRTYTFKLRTDVKWSDGVRLRAQDFIYSWKRLLSPATAASYAYLLFDVEGAEFYNKGALKDFSAVGVKAVDDSTIQVKLARPVAHWIQLPTFWPLFPLRADVVEKHGGDWAKPGRMVVLGPYQLVAQEVDTKLLLKANPSYYGQKGNIDQVTAYVVKDDSTALMLYETGKLDFLTDLASLDLKRLQGRADLKTFPYLKTGYLGFSTNKYPFTSAKARRAVAMAIDRSKIAQVMHGGQQAAGSFIPPTLLGHTKDPSLKFDPAQAKAELKAMGWDSSKPITAELLLPNWEKALVLGQFLQAELKKNLGLQVVLQPFDHKTFRAQLDLKAYPLFEGTWAADYPDPDNFLSVFLSNSGNNRTSWKSEKFDQLVLGARNSSNSKAREKMYRDAEAILIEQQAVVIPLYYEPNLGLVKPRVKGLELNPLNYLYLRKAKVEP